MASVQSRTKLLILVLVLLLVFGVLGFFGYRGTKRLFSAQQAETCTVTGSDGVEQTMSAEQAVNASIVAAVALERNMYPQAATIALATVAVETNYYNLSSGDRDSAGLFQQRPSQGWGTAEEVQDRVNASNSFYNHLEAIEDYQNQPVGETAQKIQQSGYPERYQQQADSARRWADAFTGSAEASVSCVVVAEIPAVAPATTLQEEIATDVGDAVKVEESEGNLIVTATDEYTGSDSLSKDEAKHAVLAAVSNWAVAHANDYALNSIEFDGKIWTRDKNIDRTFTAPSGWQESSATAEHVLIRQ